MSTATGNSGISELASVGATWHPTTRDTYSASFALGGAAATQGRLQILSDPASLRFDCVGKVAYGNAPGEQPQNNSSNSLRVSYTHQLHGGNVSLTLYRQVQNGVLLPVYVDGYVLNQLGALPAGYLQQVAQIYNSPAGCNTPPATPFSAQQLYFLTPVSGVQRLYQGAELTGYVTVGDLVIQPYYNLTGAQASSNSYIFDNPWSITIPGQQLPNVPLQKAGIVLDYKAPHSMFEWLADAQHVGTNNPNNLPAVHHLRCRRHRAAYARNAHLCGDEHHRCVFWNIRKPGQRGTVHNRRRIRHREHRAPADAAHVLVNLLGALRPRRTLVADGNCLPRSRQRRRSRWPWRAWF